MEEKNKNIIIFIIAVIIILQWNSYNDLKRESSANIRRCESKIRIANDYRDQANSNIEDAQSYAWSSYEEMGWALDNLETVDNISF